MMEKALLAEEILPLEQYVEKIKAKKVYHNDIPEEIKNNLAIIHAEVAAKMRVFGNRGYDVIRNRFFVEQKIKVLRFNSDVIDKDCVSTFETFGAYYDFLNGDIYDNAVYYQYEFSENEVSMYKIDTSRLSKKSFINEALAKCSEQMDTEDRRKERELAKDRAKCIKWKNKFCACTSCYSLDSVANQYSRYDYGDWEYMLSKFVSVNPENNLPLAIKFLANTNFPIDTRYLTAFCIKYREILGEYSFVNCFEGRFWKRKSEMMANIRAYDAGEYVKQIEKGYSKSYQQFYIMESIIDPKQIPFYVSVKAQFTVYYDTFDEFAQAVNFDLSDCLLQNAVITEEAINKCRTNEGTILPCNRESALYTILKNYDYANDVFVVEEVWQSNSYVLKRRKYEFKYLCDFVSFLSGDLSGAELSMCDGFINVNDFSQLSLNGANLQSNVMIKIGLFSEKETVEIAIPRELDVSLQNENNALSNELSVHPIFSFENQSFPIPIYYISDLHIDHKIASSNCRSQTDVEAYIKKIAVEITKDLSSWDTLIIAGDTTCNLDYFKIFIRAVKIYTDAKVVFVLGNHELWCGGSGNLSKVIDQYKCIIEAEGMVLLHNGVLYSEDRYKKMSVISEEEINSLSETEIRDRLKIATTIIFGGIGFSGLNLDFNADGGVYRNALTREEEIAESSKFEALYYKVRNSLWDREVIVATHMPIADWANDTEYQDGFVYISGHTHKGEYYDDGIKRIYSDNQVGYKGKNFLPKRINLEGRFDLFSEYEEGIYEITRSEYIDFYRGRNIRVNFNRDFVRLYMLKRNGYYCFMIQNEKGKLAILNGGSTKIIKNKTIESCYEEMANIIETIKTPLDKFTAIQKQISDFVKSIGGDGHIHGAIIDIDFYNHIYLNPNDLKITGYYAMSMVNKRIYRSFRGLLTAHRPDLLPAYNRYLSGDSTSAIAVLGDEDGQLTSQPYDSTDIYKVSNLLKKMQRLYSNVLTVWPEETQDTYRLEHRKLWPNG